MDEVFVSIVVSITACHAGDPDSIPGLEALLVALYTCSIDLFGTKRCMHSTTITYPASTRSTSVRSEATIPDRRCASAAGLDLRSGGPRGRHGYRNKLLCIIAA